jgi:hypothetical protein
MKYLEYIAVAIALVGALFIKWDWPFGNMLLIIGLGALAFIYALTGSIFSKIKEQRGNVMPFTVFSSLTLAAGVLSVLFSEMNWSGSGLLALYSYIALPVAIVINLYLLSKNSENILNKMAVVRAAIILIVMIVF